MILDRVSMHSIPTQWLNVLLSWISIVHKLNTIMYLRYNFIYPNIAPDSFVITYKCGYVGVLLVKLTVSSYTSTQDLIYTITGTAIFLRELAKTIVFCKGKLSYRNFKYFVQNLVFKNIVLFSHLRTVSVFSYFYVITL